MKARWIQVIAGFTMFVLCISIYPTTANATVVWSDDFNDGDYEGWTICANTVLDSIWPGEGIGGSNWSADNYNLQIDHEEWGIITHPSDIAYGTWSFDFKADEPGFQNAWIAFLSNDVILTTDNISEVQYYSLRFMGDVEVFSENFTISLRKVYNGVMTTVAAAESPVPSAGWHHIDVTRNTTGWFKVYHNGTPIIDGEDNEIDTSDLFQVWFNKRQMIDNIVVNNEIPTTTTEPPPTIPPEILVIVGGVVVVLIVLVVVFVKRR